MLINEKQKRYMTMKRKLKNSGDRLGRKIDKNIFETIVYLNLLDIPTSASCEGHLDHGVAAPWIDFVPRPSRTLTKLQKRAEKQLGNLLLAQESAKLSKKLDSLQEVYTDTLDEISELLLTELKPLVDLLTTHYREHECEYEQMLVLRNNYQWARLASVGELFQESRTPEEKKRALVYYQREMHEFTRFLRRTYEGN